MSMHSFFSASKSEIVLNQTFSLFQGVEHVFIVGVGGGVPHYTDWGRHVSCCLADDLYDYLVGRLVGQLDGG